MAIFKPSLTVIVCVYLLFCCIAEEANSASVPVPHHSKYHGSGAEVDQKMGFVSFKCESISQDALAQILGSAFNSRYMSVDPPSTTEEPSERSSSKRHSNAYRPFAVDDDFAQDLSETPAWEVDHLKAQSSGEVNRRMKRATNNEKTPWECTSVIKWIDLGWDYFPRYLRSVECTKHDCWYGKYTCQPRSFTVKLLRRKQGRCVYKKRPQGSAGLPDELRELWIWEERAVNFCCDCSS